MWCLWRHSSHTINLQRKGCRKQWYCSLQMRTLQFVLHWWVYMWVASWGRTPLHVAVWYKDEKKTMRKSPSVFPLPGNGSVTGFSWVQWRSQQPWDAQMTASSQWSWGAAVHITNTSRKVYTIRWLICHRLAPVVHPVSLQKLLAMEWETATLAARAGPAFKLTVICGQMSSLLTGAW